MKTACHIEWATQVKEMSRKTGADIGVVSNVSEEHATLFMSHAVEITSIARRHNKRLWQCARDFRYGSVALCEDSVRALKKRAAGYGPKSSRLRELIKYNLVKISGNEIEMTSYGHIYRMGIVIGEGSV